MMTMTKKKSVEEELAAVVEEESEELYNQRKVETMKTRKKKKKKKNKKKSQAATAVVERETNHTKSDNNETPPRKEQVVYFLFNSAVASNSAALYRLKFFIIFDDAKNKILLLNKTDDLEKVANFFPQDYNRRTLYVAIAPLVDDDKYLLLPNEFDETFYIRYRREPCTYPREEPLIYTLGGDKKRTLLKKIKQPLGLKVEPMAVTVGNKVYALSRRSVSQNYLPEPSFEVYDPVKNKWETLPPPWVNKDNNIHLPSPHSNENWFSPGYAVLGHLIIVCFQHWRDQSLFHIHSYDTLSREWKPVSIPHTGVVLNGQYGDSTYYSVDYFNLEKDSCPAYDEDGYEVPKYTAANYLVWEGEAVVVNSYIYCYVKEFRTLAWFKCSSEKGDYLSLDGFVFMEDCDSLARWRKMAYTMVTTSGAIGRIGDDMICLVKTVLSNANVGYRQPVHITTFRLSEQGGIRARLQYFDLFMPGDHLFRSACISSCFIQPPEVASSSKKEREEPGPDAFELSPKVASSKKGVRRANSQKSEV